MSKDKNYSLYLCTYEDACISPILSDKLQHYASQPDEPLRTLYFAIGID